MPRPLPVEPILPTTAKLNSGIIWTLGKRLKKGGFGSVHTATPSEVPASGTPRLGYVAKLVPKAEGGKRELLLGDDLAGVPNVVPVIDTGETPKFWVLVMPRAEMSLEDRLKRTPPDLAETVAILNDILTALEALDAKRVVHRDIKPSNILFWNGHWCLADFGISRYAEATTAPDTQKFSWTDPYAAPERWLHQRAAISADVYAVGVTAFEMLTGSLPFNGPLREDYREQHLHQSPPALPADIPSSISIAISQMLAKPGPSRPNPPRARESLTRAASARSSPALSRLGRIGEAESRRLSGEETRKAKAEERKRLRVDLYHRAEDELEAIKQALFNDISSHVPSASWTAESLSVGGATLELPSSLIRAPEERWNAPSFEVIAGTSISLKLSIPKRAYRGRSHSLWYCDAREAGRYQWFELAFMNTPGIIRRTPENLDPFSMAPGSSESAVVFQMVMGTYQLAWPMEPLDISDMSEFIDRWVEWLAKAAEGRLDHPGYMPEKETHGSFRLK